MKFEIAIGVGFLLLAAAACGDDDSSASADTVSVGGATTVANEDAAAAFATTDALTNPFFLAQHAGSSPTESSTNPTVAAASSAAAAADHYFTPASCVIATSDGSEVSYKLTSCNGPFGVTQANGTVNVTFSMLSPSVDAGAANSSSVGFTLSSTALSLDGETAILSANGTYTRDASGQKVVVLHSNSKFTRDNHQISDQTTSTITWQAGTQCIDVDATGTLAALGQTTDLEVKNFKRCAGACPQSGSVQTTGFNTVTLTLDGTNHPSFKSSNGQNGTVSLDCGG